MPGHIIWGPRSCFSIALPTFFRMTIRLDQCRVRYEETGNIKAACSNHDIHDLGQSLDKDIIGCKEQRTMTRT